MADTFRDGRELNQAEARLRCATYAMLAGQYPSDANELKRHFHQRHTMREDVKLLCERNGGNHHRGGNNMGIHIPAELLAFAWPGSTAFDMLCDTTPGGVSFGNSTKTRIFYRWQEIAQDIRDMFGTYFKSATADAFDPGTGKELREMTEIITNEATQELHRIEMRIATHYQHAADELIGVGLCLIEAKEKKLVPHGEWEAWLRDHTGMSERSAQRLMAAAREVPQGSVLSSLPFSQVTAILALPEPEREEMAQQAATDNMSTRELQEAVKARQEAERQADAWKKAQQKSEVRVSTAEREKAKAEKELENLKKDIPKLAEQMAAEHLEQINDEVEELRVQLEDAKKAVASGGAGTDAEAQQLRADLEAAETRLRDQMKKRQEAQTELLNLKKQLARGDVPGDVTDGLTLDGMAEAARSFLGKVGTLPHMGSKLAGLSAESRDTWEQYIDMVGAWVEGARKALQVIDACVDVN